MLVREDEQQNSLSLWKPDDVNNKRWYEHWNVE